MINRLFGSGLFNASDKEVSFSCGEDTFYMADLSPAFKETREGQCALLALAACQVALIQTNQNASVGYFEVTCLGPDSRLLQNFPGSFTY